MNCMKYQRKQVVGLCIPSAEALGVKTLWIGLQRVMDFAIDVKFLREVEAKNCV